MGNFGYIFGYTIFFAFLIGYLIGDFAGYYKRKSEETKEIQKLVDNWNKYKSRY